MKNDLPSCFLKISVEVSSFIISSFSAIIPKPLSIKISLISSFLPFAYTSGLIKNKTLWISLDCKANGSTSGKRSFISLIALFSFDEQWIPFFNILSPYFALKLQ